MSSEIKIVGNLTADPELRFTPSGSAVANFTVAETPRKFDRQTNEWKDDGLANFFRCTVWGEYAENVAESLRSGTRVIVTGRLKTQEFKGKDGEARTSSNNVEVDEVAPTLRYASAVVTKNNRNAGGRGGAGNARPAYQDGSGVAGSRPAYQGSNESEVPF